MKLLISFVMAVLLIALVYTFSYAEDFGWDNQYTFSDWANPEMVGNGGIGLGMAWLIDWVAQDKFNASDNVSKFLQFGGVATENYLINARYQRFHDEEGASIPEMAINQVGGAIYTFFIDKPKNGQLPSTQIVPLKNGLAMTIRF